MPDPPDRVLAQKCPARPPQHPQNDDDEDEEILDTVHVSAATAAHQMPPPPDFLTSAASQAAYGPLAQAAPVPMSGHRDFKSSVKIERLATLEGSKNYDLWSQQMLMVFDALEATQVVTKDMWGYLVRQRKWF
ncbi:hypothetical protein L211DRAFT_838978 [Terfezia boudieri ATCC MYA-4762]|uniref:Uncharacterized protein n=1 Tax=Terfezia boudieri ATCC MYA-4762 TaxID=1051890 RepID=A0A3N4LJE6_9PEZI|nr:hypothetical protein L211DRAFT_838978 [Terfezia boudieri ATCC MYA-4762]